ncbi:MAG TPA: PH domain-containing protein [Candidatus Paceibacterota bacterium]|nr:PH domain-containing protein [Candidatus Paceibacterota bacterium]
MNSDSEKLNVDSFEPQRLGPRAYSLILDKYATTPIIFFVITIIALIVRVKGSFGHPAFVNQIIFWSIGLLILGCIYTLAAAHLIYRSYTFSIGEDAFKITKGIFAKKETAIPYRQIRDVNIERSFYQRLCGVSKLIVLTPGSGTAPAGGFSASESVLPIIDNIDKRRAVTLQAELLRRANIQKVTTT